MSALKDYRRCLRWFITEAHKEIENTSVIAKIDRLQGRIKEAQRRLDAGKPYSMNDLDFT